MTLIARTVKEIFRCSILPLSLSSAEWCNAFENSTSTRSSSRRIIKWAIERGLKEIIEEIGERGKFRERWKAKVYHILVIQLDNSTRKLQSFFNIAILRSSNFVTISEILFTKRKKTNPRNVILRAQTVNITCEESE